MLFNTMKTGLHFRNSLIKRIINGLSNLSLIDNNITELRLLMKDVAHHDEVRIILEDKAFEPELWRQLQDHGIVFPSGIVFKWKFVQSAADIPKDSMDIDEGYWLKTISPKSEAQEKRFAEIEILRGKGRPARYQLENTADKKYNIGHGKHVQLDNGMRHTNDIVFEKISGEQQETDPNRYISRFHAVILYSKTENRLCLKTIGANKILIFRVKDGQQQTVDVNNTLIEYPIEHDDQIQLGGDKGGLLRFRFVPDCLTE